MSWGETLASQKSALRWDIKRTMKDLCKKLAEIGEECFVVTANVSNGWVGHMGSVHGTEYLNEKMFIAYDFLDYCRESGSGVVETEEDTDSTSESGSPCGSDNEGSEVNREGEETDDDNHILISRASSMNERRAYRNHLRMCKQRIKQKVRLSKKRLIHESHVDQPYIRQSPYPLRERKQVSRFVLQDGDKQNREISRKSKRSRLCRLCNRSFVHRKLFNAHMTLFHRRTESLRISRMSSCYRCGFLFNGRTALLRHGIQCARNWRMEDSMIEVSYAET